MDYCINTTCVGVGVCVGACGTTDLFKKIRKFKKYLDSFATCDFG